ncbi:hypothetical protein [Providencia phage Kokobel2]|nr:hypothetical protein [Providencia phage Kokobel2]
MKIYKLTRPLVVWGRPMHGLIFVFDTKMVSIDRYNRYLGEFQ